MPQLNPLDRSTAILEIVILLLIAAIIGFVTAWLYYRSIYRRKIAALEGEFADYKSKHVPKTELEASQKALKEASEARSLLSIDLSAANRRIQVMETELKAITLERDQAKKEGIKLSGQLGERNTELLACRSRSKELDAQLAALNLELGKLGAAVKKGDLRIAQLEKELAVCNEKQTLVAIPDVPKPKVSKTGSKKEVALEKVRAKRGTINFDRIGIATAQDKDDLKIIKGIGPFIEEKLNALDIFKFAQIANFIDEDVVAVTKAIEFFPGRIVRDNWVTQAADLRDQK